jgi:hypothetical protein
VPVDAPDGTAARPIAPFATITSASTVGLPRESMISRALMSAIFVIASIPRMAVFHGLVQLLQHLEQRAHAI